MRWADWSCPQVGSIGSSETAEASKGKTTVEPELAHQGELVRTLVGQWEAHAGGQHVEVNMLDMGLHFNSIDMLNHISLDPNVRKETMMGEALGLGLVVADGGTDQG